MWNSVSANEHLLLSSLWWFYMVSSRKPSPSGRQQFQRRFWFLITDSVTIARSVRFSMDNLSYWFGLFAFGQTTSVLDRAP